MPPKIPSIKLAKVGPTNEEVFKAQEILQGIDPKALKSKMPSMAHFLKTSGDTAALASRGSDRVKNLELFLIHQMRSKEWVSAEKMDLLVGAQKGKTWRESGRLKTRADPITGSSEPHMIEYRIPECWETFSEEDLHQLMIESVTEASGWTA